MVTKKIASVVVIILMLLSLSLTAFADSVGGLSGTELSYAVYNNTYFDYGTTLPIGSTNNSTRRDAGCQIGLVGGNLFPVGFYALRVIHSYSCTGSWGSEVTVDFLNLYVLGRTDWAGSGTATIYSSSNQAIIDGTFITFVSVYYFQITESSAAHPFNGVWLKVNVPPSASNTNGKGLDSVEFYYDEEDYPEFPEPEPLPEEGQLGSLSDDYSVVPITYYYQNSKTYDSSINGDDHDPSNYLWTLPNDVSQVLPWGSFFCDKNVPFLFFCADFGSNLITANSVFSGQLSLIYTNPYRRDFTLGNIDFHIKPFEYCYLWLTNGTDPSDPDFEYFIIPPSWNCRNALLEYVINDWDARYVCNFYFVIPDDFLSQIPFTPTNLAFYFDPVVYPSLDSGMSPYVAPSITEEWYKWEFFVLGRNARSSSSDPIPDPGTSTPPSDHEVNQIVEALDEEGNRIQQSYDLDSMDEAALNVFNLESFSNAFGGLVSALGYSGTDFSFKLPASGEIPFLDRELWQETEIPIRYYIDALPVAILYVIRFLAWSGLAFSFVWTVRKLVHDLNGGD